MTKQHFDTTACVLAVACLTPAVRAQSGKPEAPGADMAFADIPRVQHWTLGGAIDGVRAYSLGDVACNVGSEPMDWFAGPNPRHPVMAQNMYRLLDGRFEQIGMSWLKHGFCALQQEVCQTCAPVCGGCCTELGVGCSDPYSASRNGQFSNLGPRHEINPHLGTNLGSHAFAEGDNAIRGRIQVRESDLNNPGATYYAEGQYIAEDDAQTGDMTNDNNNASWRQIAFDEFFLANVSGTTHREEIAMYAWQDADPLVTIVHVDVPDEGRFTLGYRVTDNGDGTWHYEYALYNMNSDRSARSFAVPMAAGVSPQDVGFHDIDYHSGEPYALTDWTISSDDEILTWATQTWQQNENANALRWGTLYNFRFDANTEPQPGSVEIGLFKPGTPESMTVPAVVPSPACVAPAFMPAQVGVSFAERAFDGFIDARAESSDGLNNNLGIREITLAFTLPLENLDGTPLSANAFTITDTAGAAPGVTGVTTADARTITIALDDSISLQEWTTITVNARAQCNGDLTITDALDVGYLPADVNNDGTVTPFDLLTFRQYVSEAATPERGIIGDYVDTNRDNTVSPFDLLAFRQLINGVSPPATRSWGGQSLPLKP